MKSWRSRAKCRTPEGTEPDPTWIDPELIPVPKGANAQEWRQMVAGGMCSGCPVIDECRREVVEMQDSTMIKGGYALTCAGHLLDQQYNQIRTDLGMPRARTHHGTILERFPAPCTSCGHPIRVIPMKKKDWPGTRLGSVRSGRCIQCDLEEKENGNGNTADED